MFDVSWERERDSGEPAADTFSDRTVARGPTEGLHLERENRAIRTGNKKKHYKTVMLQMRHSFRVA